MANCGTDWKVLETSSPPALTTGKNLASPRVRFTWSAAMIVTNRRWVIFYVMFAYTAIVRLTQITPLVASAPREQRISFLVTDRVFLLCLRVDVDGHNGVQRRRVLRQVLLGRTHDVK